MKITQWVHLKKRSARREELDECLKEVRQAISQVVWPPSSKSFTINPDVNKQKQKKTKSGKKGIHLNGVIPIKSQFALQLSKHEGWHFEEPMKAEDGSGRTSLFDAWKPLMECGAFALEWETGNISSSHRSLNRIVLACLRGTACGGIVILPDVALYKLLTDRVGNFDELKMYFPVWEALSLDIELIVAAVSYDQASSKVPYIPRGEAGNAFRGRPARTAAGNRKRGRRRA